MYRKRTTLVIMLLMIISLLTVSACSSQSVKGNNAGSSITAKQTSIKAQLNGDLVLIPTSEVDKYTNTRFLVNSATERLSFMAYKYNNQLYVRADICPPCGSESFTLTNGTLVCDTCGTVFNAKTGSGMKGACVKYNKVQVVYEVKDGNIVMKGTDLSSAFQNTLNPRKS
jgi:nitrite reductase/ring-hydroxylating ferredoxin subunit